MFGYQCFATAVSGDGSASKAQLNLAEQLQVFQRLEHGKGLDVFGNINGMPFAVIPLDIKGMFAGNWLHCRNAKLAGH
ncbi:hypothetical protein D3C87_1152160 [compost metagenome]